MDFEKLIYLDQIKFYQWSSKDTQFSVGQYEGFRLIFA